MAEMTQSAGVVRARTVLVTEDDAQIRRAVKTALADSAERIVEAANGREGLGLAASWRPDLVVLDLGLPDMPGIEVCREIRSWSKMPVVVLTARHSEDEGVTVSGPGDLVSANRSRLARCVAAPLPSL